MLGLSIVMNLYLGLRLINSVLRGGLNQLSKQRIWIDIIWHSAMVLEFASARYPVLKFNLTKEHFFDGDAKAYSDFVQEVSFRVG
jgi:hypothetical protein